MEYGMEKRLEYIKYRLKEHGIILSDEIIMRVITLDDEYTDIIADLLSEDE